MPWESKFMHVLWQGRNCLQQSGLEVRAKLEDIPSKHLGRQEPWAGAHPNLPPLRQFHYLELLIISLAHRDRWVLLCWVLLLLLFYQ